MKTRRIIVPLILIHLLFSLMPVQADCTVMLFYSVKDWVAHQDFWDSEFTSDQQMVINSQQITAEFNALGTFSNPRRTDWEVLAGLKTLTVNGNENPDDPNFIAAFFGKPIHIRDLQMEVQGWNENGEELEKTVWVNAEMNWVNGRAELTSGEQVLSTKEKRITLNLQEREIRNLYVVFNESGPQCHYQLSYFQIPQYEVKEHIRWTPEKIENTDIRQVTVCLDGGTFNPDGTQGIWKKESAGVFTPSTSLLVQQEAEIQNQSDFYDYGRGGSIPAYANPDVVKGLDSYANLIQGWYTEEQGGGFRYRYYSYGSKGKAWPWIETKPGWGVQYTANPIYWTQNGNLPHQIWSSDDAGWCQHTTGSRSTPCYKYEGHSTNARLNSYDVTVVTYKNLYDPKEHWIAEARYTLIDTLTQQKTDLGRMDGSPFAYTLDQSGRWQIEAWLQDEAGNTETVTSDHFLIDNIAPEVQFNPSGDETWKRQPIVISTEILDKHSGVKRWRWAVSVDGGMHFGRYGEWQETPSVSLTLNQNGLNVIKVEAEDQAGNRSVTISDSYKIDQLPPVSERSWIEDETGKVLADGNQVFTNWINGSAQLSVHTGKVEDRPANFNSGVHSVVAKTSQDKINLIPQNGMWSAPLNNDKEGRQTLTLTACDHAQNCADIADLEWRADLHGPQIDWTLTPNDWTNTDVLIQIQAKDELSGVESLVVVQKVVQGEKAQFTVKENGKYQVSAQDYAGNITTVEVPVGNIDRLPPWAVFDPVEAETDDNEIEVSVTPQDDLSGVKRWRYRITYDEGQSFIRTSPWFEDETEQKVILTMAGQCQIVVEIEDRAGNEGTSISGYYQLHEGDASAGQLFVPAAHPGQVENAMLHVICAGCNPQKQQTVTVWLQDEVIFEQQLPALPEQTVRIPFELESETAQMRAWVDYELDKDPDNNELLLNIAMISRQFKQTSEEQLEFNGPVMFTVTQGEDSSVANETLTLISPYPEGSYFAGEGIEAAIQYHYVNECAFISDWACIADTKLINAETSAVFDQGALPVREKYAVENHYEVPLQRLGDSFILPMMWATQYEGKINNEPVFENLDEDDQILEAGHRWYTNPLQDPKELTYMLQGQNLAVNEFSFRLLRTAMIDSRLKDQYRIKFADPQDVLTFDTPLWQPYLDWFAQLAGKEPLATELPKQN